MAKAKVVPLNQDADTLKKRERIYLRASQLTDSPYQVRKIPHDAEHIGQVAASIKSLGLLRALLALSLADNIQKELHPADQYEAIRAMVERGLSIERAAISLNLSLVNVKRLLRLADVHPALLLSFRSGDIELEQLMALAVCTDQARQLEVWEAADNYSDEPHQLRAAIVGDRIDAARDPRVKFIGLDAYLAAGGAMENDLFSQDGESGFVLDSALLDRLVGEKLTAESEVLRAEGWGWIEARPSFRHSEQQQFSTLPEVQRDPTEPEIARRAAIEARLNEIEELDEIDEAQSDEASALEDEWNALEAQLYSFPEEGRAHGGVVVSIDHKGQLQIARGLVRKEDAKAAKEATTGSIEQPETAEKKAKPELSDSLMRRITAHQSLAIQSQLAAQPDVALALLVTQLSLSLFPTHSDYVSLDINVDTRIAELDRVAENLADNPARALLDERVQVWAKLLPKKKKERLAWLLDRSRDDLVELLALCVSATYSCVRGDDSTKPVRELLVDRLDIDMATFWEPSPANYLNYVSKQQILDVVREAIKPATAAVQALQDMKVTPMRTAAFERLQGLNWLPKVLRRKAAKPAKRAKAKAATKTD